MGTNAEELRREIEMTRTDLGDTFEAIGDRVSPSRIVERKKNRMTGAIRTARERVMGVGVDTGHAIGGTAHSMKDSVTGTASGAVSSVAGTAHEMPQALRGQTQGSPIAAGAIAFGIGFIAAAAFPASRTERQMASGVVDKIEPIKAELSATAHGVMDNLKEPAQDAVAAVKETAADSAHAVQDTAKDAAQQTKDAAQQAKTEGQPTLQSDI